MLPPRWDPCRSFCSNQRRHDAHCALRVILTHAGMRMHTPTYLSAASSVMPMFTISALVRAVNACKRTAQKVQLWLIRTEPAELGPSQPACAKVEHPARKSTRSRKIRQGRGSTPHTLPPYLVRLSLCCPGPLLCSRKVGPARGHHRLVRGPRLLKRLCVCVRACVCVCVCACACAVTTCRKIDRHPADAA